MKIPTSALISVLVIAAALVFFEYVYPKMSHAPVTADETTTSSSTNSQTSEPIAKTQQGISQTPSSNTGSTQPTGAATNPTTETSHTSQPPQADNTQTSSSQSLDSVFGQAMSELIADGKKYPTPDFQSGDRNIQLLQAQADIMFQMMLLTNELRMKQYGSYLSSLPNVQFTNQGNNIYTAPQFYYELDPTGKSYIMCRYSLIEPAHITPLCISSSNALAYLQNATPGGNISISDDTLLHYPEKLDQAVKNHLAQTTDGKYTTVNLTSLTLRTFEKEPTVSQYMALDQALYDDFKSTIVEPTKKFMLDMTGSSTLAASKADNWTNSFLEKQLINLLIAYYDEHKEFPLSFSSLLPTGANLADTYQTIANKQDFILCQGSDGSSCIHKDDAINIFMLEQSHVFFVNNIYANAMSGTEANEILSTREDVSLQLGLITLKKDVRDFLASRGRFPNDIDEFYNAYKSHYADMVNSGYLTLAGGYDSASDTFVVKYQVKELQAREVDISKTGAQMSDIPDLNK